MAGGIRGDTVLRISWWYLKACFALAVVLVLITGVSWYSYGSPGHVFAKGAQLLGAGSSEKPTAGFELAKISLQALLGLASTLLLAAGAYIVVTHAKSKNEALQTSLARFNLITGLNQEIRTVYNSLAVYGAERTLDPAPVADDGQSSTDGKSKPTSKLAASVLTLAHAVETAKRVDPATATPKAIPFICVVDRKTTWLGKCDREWNHLHGERTVRFIAKSHFSADAEISTVALHDYMHWFRRLKLGMDTEILSPSDIDMYWRYLVGFCSGRRFSFMWDIFEFDMRDYAFLLSMVVVREVELGMGRDSVRSYIANDDTKLGPDPGLMENLTPEARMYVEDYVKSLPSKHPFVPIA